MNLNMNMNMNTYEMVLSAMTVIKEMDCENDIIHFDDTKKGFLFSSSEQINNIKMNIESTYGGHSGASLANTLRCCQYFLQNSNEWDQIVYDFQK